MFVTKFCVRDLVLLHFLQQFAASHLHATEGEPLFAEIFDAGAEVVDRFVDAEKTVV